MCTAISYRDGDHYFGRNLDVEGSYREGVVITPRNFPLPFRYIPEKKTHYAMIGMATVVDGYPLYFDATNEKGLSIAGLNFPGNAVFAPYAEGKNNIAPFELTPYILSQCTSAEEAEALLSETNLVHLAFREDIPVTPLHWMISDRERSLVLECTKDGMRIYHNPFGVLTNSPPFPFHRENLHRYMGLHEGPEARSLSSRLPLENISLGFGAMGLPGDFSSISRFVKAVFVKEKSLPGHTQQDSIAQFFRILQSVAMPKGCVLMETGAYEYTRYSSCCNTDKQEYSFQTYDAFTLRKICLRDHNLNAENLLVFKVE